MTRISRHQVFLPTVLGLFLAALPCQASYEEDSWVFNRQGMLKVSQGRLNEAIHDFEKACQINPYNDTALANLACARNNLGVIMAQQKNFDEAIRQFNAAKAQKPEDVSIRLNLLSVLVNLKDAAAVEQEAREITSLRPNDVETGLKVAAALQKTENSSAAVQTLQDLASRVSDHAELHATLGRLLYRSGQLDASAYHLKKSHELNPGDAETRAMLDRLARESTIEDGVSTHTGLHFSLTCPDSFGATWANEVLELLEEAHYQIGEQLDFYPNQRSQVIILQTDAFRKVHDLPEWAGGLYDGKIRLPVPERNTRPAALKGAIMHEYTHHVVYLITAGNCPIWFNEGLAQIFENNHEKLDQFINLPTGDYASFDEIDRRFRQNPDRKTAAALYQTAMATTARMVSEHSWSKIAAFLEYLGMGYDINQAATEALAIEFAELEKVCLPSEKINQTQ